MAFAPIKRWKLPYITRWESFQNRNPPIISADEVHILTVTNATYATEAYRATATLFTLNTAGSVRPVVTNVVCSGGSCSFDVLTAAGQTLTVVSTTDCALPLAQWLTLLTTNSPGAREHIIDPRPATSRVMVYGVCNGT